MLNIRLCVWQSAVGYRWGHWLINPGDSIVVHLQKHSNTQQLTRQNNYNNGRNKPKNESVAKQHSTDTTDEHCQCREIYKYWRSQTFENVFKTWRRPVQRAVIVDTDNSWTNGVLSGRIYYSVAFCSLMLLHFIWSTHCDHISLWKWHANPNN